MALFVLNIESTMSSGLFVSPIVRVRDGMASCSRAALEKLFLTSEIIILVFVVVVVSVLILLIRLVRMAMFDVMGIVLGCWVQVMMLRLVVVVRIIRCDLIPFAVFMIMTPT